MMDDKRKRVLSSQIGHDLSRDLTLIAYGVVTANNIGPGEQGLSPFATLARSCGKDFGIRPIVGAVTGQKPKVSPTGGSHLPHAYPTSTK
jgi:hypothetical protein